MPRIALKAIKQQEAEVRRMRRKSSISSSIIALMVVVVLMLVLMLIRLPGISRESPVVIAYSAPGMNDEDLSPRKNFSHLRAKPASPSSSALSRVISAATASSITVPTLDIEVPEPSLSFGSGDDFGDGWGGGGGGGGDGGGGGGGGFFRQEIKSTRVCFVIDFSQSMQGERDNLMRTELSKSVRNLRLGMQFQMIFFAGPAWVAGSKVEITGGRKAAVVRLGRDSYRWKSPGNAFNWSPVGSRQKPDWISTAPHQRNDALRLIGNSSLVWGTNWENPLVMALSMDPPPQEIFFMTDGAVTGDMMKLARQLGERARAKGTVINTVAMMEPKAEEALKELAKRTGGQFTIVRKGGKVVPMD